MGRRKKYRPEEESDPELDISSLVDVAFLLLIYFLVTSTLRPDETDLSIVLPSQVPNENPLDIDPIAIVIGPDGSVTYNEEVIPISGGKNSKNRETSGYDRHEG
jgi:biopolymer transport protein ExbD